MYVATIVLVLRHNLWGYLLGISIASFWNYANLFVTSFFRAGLQQLSILLHTGTLPRPDLFISVPAVAFHFVMIVCCLAAWLRLSRKEPADALRFAIVFLGSTAYFAVAMMLTQPRYLSIFPRLLHPELHV
jgi:ABC-type lipoprotein release transport system permease subunit